MIGLTAQSEPRHIQQRRVLDSVVKKHVKLKPKQNCETETFQRFNTQFLGLLGHRINKLRRNHCLHNLGSLLSRCWLASCHRGHRVLAGDTPQNPTNFGKGDAKISGVCQVPVRTVARNLLCLVFTLWSPKLWSYFLEKPWWR